MFTRKKFNQVWEGKMEPFRIIGNVYFCGTFQASCHLIDTGDGLIMIDPGYARTLYLVVNSIYKLGFKPEDIKYIINTHWHGDHTQCNNAMKDLTGAKTMLCHHDVEPAKLFFKPDLLIKDGDTLTLGNTTIHFMETPGHTKGTISFFFDAEEDGKTYRVGMFGGAGANTLAQGEMEYPECREDFRNSVHKLQKEHVDVFIGNHVWNNDTETKGKLLLETGENKFIDDKIWHEFLTFCEKRLDVTIAKDK